MHRERLAFVGGGRIVRIMLGGWRNAGCLPDDLAIVEPDAGIAQQLQAAFPSIRLCGGLSDAVQNATIVFLAVHPPQLLSMAENVAPLLRPGTLVVSLAPKITLVQLDAYLPKNCPRCRVLPNAPAIFGQGFNPIAVAEGWHEADQTRIEALMGPLGDHPVVPEEHLEAYAIVTALGPTYFWFQWQLLEELGQQFGLSAEMTRHGLAQTLRGAASTYFDAGLTPDEVQQLIPVQPLREHAPAIAQYYRDSLAAMHQKIQPQRP